MIGWVLKAKSVFGGAEIENRLDPRFQPNVLVVGCAIGAFSIYTNLQWQSKLIRWAEWQVPVMGSVWERIYIDQGSPVVNKSQS